MDSYNLFGDDGSGMLEGLTDIGGTDSYNNSTGVVATENKDATDNSYRQPFQGSVAQDSSLQKLPPYGGGSSSGIGGGPQGVSGAGAGPPTSEYHEYGAYPPPPPRARVPQPPHAALHPSHHGHPGHSYPGYHPSPDPIYGIPDHQGIGDLWSTAPAPNRYSPITPSYRHTYDHQQKMHQYQPQQNPSLGNIQSQNGGYMPRQHHFPQAPQGVYGQQQAYPSYTQMHPPSTPRHGQHPTYHQQMEVNPHQYGPPHSQQSHAPMQQHQPQQNVNSHQGPLPTGIQGAHGNMHMHHAGAPALHHGTRQPGMPPSSVGPGIPGPMQMPYATSHHSVNYQGHQVQHPLDVNVSNQYNAPKPQGLETGSPHYRPQFHQISPQVSPRAQISPRPPAPSQSSPRPVISPVKGPNASPHGSRLGQPPPTSNTATSASYATQNTLQALEQMVLPTASEYAYQRNPASPALGNMTAASPWNQKPSIVSLNSAMHTEPTEKLTKSSEMQQPVIEVKNDNLQVDLEKHAMEKEKSKESHVFIENKPSPQNMLNTHSSNETIVTKNNPIEIGSNSDYSVPNLTNISNKPEISKSNEIDKCDVVNTQSDALINSDKQSENANGDHEKIIKPLPVTLPGNSLASVMPQPQSGTTTAGSLPVSETMTRRYEMPIMTIDKNQVYSPQSKSSDMLSQELPNLSNPLINPNLPPFSSGVTGQNLPSQNNELSTKPLSHAMDNLSGLGASSHGIPSQIHPNVHPSINSQPVMLPTVHPGPTASIPSTLPNITSNTQAFANVPMNVQGMHTHLPHTAPPTQPSMPPMPQNHIGSVAPIIGPPPVSASNMQGMPLPGMPPSGIPAPVLPASGVPHPGMPPQVPPGMPPGMYPMPHHQERAALQQQIQEIYCLPPSPENQEKVRNLQERLAILQQHETVDKCNGGPNCLLQNNIYAQKMVESPQVSSTTGRGRGRGGARPRKPRAKKEKPGVFPPITQLPLSEDCVTAGTGVKSSTDMEIDMSGDITNLDSSMVSLDESMSAEKVRKPRGPRKNKERKPRIPKEPKSPKVKGEKPVKERKKREPRDPNAPKRKRILKKDLSDIQADTTTNSETFEQSNLEGSLTETSKTEDLNVNVINPIDDSSTVTDFDDIPVSKIAIKDLLEDAEAKREELDDDDDSLFNQSSRRRSGKRRGSSKKTLKRTPTGRRKKRGGIVPDSDGEPDDLASTPPPSPPPEGECDNSKRRSARHTQRKKYTDDVGIRLSDDEFVITPVVKREVKDVKVDDSLTETKEMKSDAAPKPNYIYVNTTDEDSMIVQHILASRMGKREKREDPPEPNKTKINTDIEKDESNEIKDEKLDYEPKEAKENIDSSDNKIIGSEPKLKVPDEDSNTPIEPKSSSIISEPEQPEQEASVEHISDKPNEDDLPEKVKDVNVDNSVVSEEDKNTQADKKPIMVEVEEFFVKYRNFSYLHCEWKTEDELYKGDKRIFSKIKRFKQKQAQQMNIFELLDDEPFNPDYVEVERVLDVSENVDPGNESVVKHYLVKWKSLQYEDSTWELEEDVDVEKINQFKVFSEIPPKDKWKYRKRPPADSWVQLDESPLYKGGNTLRPYQLEGLNWLLFSWHNNRNCILADEMGLGKTIQSLTFVNSVWEYGIRGPFLIIAPLSTIPNWQREFEGWTDMNVVVYHGSQQSKTMLQEYEFYYKNDKGEPIKDITKFNVLITTFEIIVTDFHELKLFNWRICVIDEAHRLKNRNCKLLEGLRQLNLEHRVLLSGTPLQNNVNELFSLLNFLEPSQFSSNETFLNEFGQLKSESEVIKLQALLKPMMLRRLKEDVEKTLAPKEETIVEVELTNIQKKYYRAILERNFSFLQKGISSAANIPNLMNTMMELRKCCIHPYLLNGAEDQIQFDYKQANGEDSEAYYKALIQSSGKMVLVDKLLPKLKAGGHRVLVFSQMVRCLDILEDYLLFRKYPYERIDGRIRGNLRQEAIDRFSKPDSDRFVFLLCTKAGGLGINLTAADTVIIYDSDWNPQNDLQAQARCHRIGQQKMVKIYRLICRNTYEREMFDKAGLKLGLDKAILQSMNTGQGKETGLRQLSKKEIEDLLKKGAYGAVMDEDNAGDQFCEEDIEMILARRTQVIQMESEKGSTFSKASFAANNQRSDIDIRDPDFWNKWAKKADIDTTEKKEDEELIVTEPRKRNVIKRYGHDDGNMEISDMEATPDSEEDEEGISLRSKKKKDKLGKRGRKYGSDDYIPRHEGAIIEDEVVYGSWTRSECFKIERGLLTFGWARWDEIVDKNQFRKGWTMPVIEDCARIIVLYCLRHYKGDEKIRNFIWDLIEPCENGEVTIARNHSGLHNPVPRGRNAKKKNRPKDVPKPNDVQKWEDPNHWSFSEKYDCEAYLESSYKKHLLRHANKVLLRVRMMYYIKHEVIGEYATKIESGVHASALGMRVPRGVDSAPPRLWWDNECDISLLVGTYAHGYENYLAMRSDPQLCFVEKLGPPDDAECTDIKSEERLTRARAGGGGADEDCTDEVSSGAGALSPSASPRASPRTSPRASPRPDSEPVPDESAASSHAWPSMQDLNTRLRRLITAYQRNYKREELKLQQRAKMERRGRADDYGRDEVSQWRWTKADEEAFRRTVASYGVEFDPTTKSLRWARFRALAHLDSKSDDALTDYLKAFMAMCKRQCGLSVGEAELPTRADLKAEPIGEERAIATLERIDLLRVLREEVAPHGALESRLSLCEAGTDTPPWWQSAHHDKLLVRAVCKHGLGDTYHKIFSNPKLPFHECARKWYSRKGKRKPESQKGSSDEDDSTVNSEDTSKEPRMSLRRRTRNSNPEERDDDLDLLSELETLAKLGRTDDSLPPNHWFSERALETRLHHIAHAVQNSEWPAPSDVQKASDAAKGKADERKHSAKRHIAIDVETERAKLHALLSSPRAGSSGAGAGAGASVGGAGGESPRRAPPPAHQRAAAAACSPAPVDLSAPLDLSDGPVRRATPAPSPSPSPAPAPAPAPSPSPAPSPAHSLSHSHPHPHLHHSASAPSPSPSPAHKGRLDDTLTKLLKRKNAPVPEPIVEKEKKRKKLDEIVLGLSAARNLPTTSHTSAMESPRSKTTPVLANVSVTPVAPPTSSPAHSSSQKPFSVTVTSVPSPQASSRELSSFLQQSLEHINTGKDAKGSTAAMKQFSHEAKVNKWLAEQSNVEIRRRAATPRLSPDEHVPVVHRGSGKRLAGNKAPQLKHLAHWIAENPMYDIDPKWTEGIKEHVKLPQDVRTQRHSAMQAATSMQTATSGGERKKGRPPTLDSSSANILTNAHLNQSFAGLNPALLASLGGFDPKAIASTLSSLSGFDPKLLNSFDPKLLASLSSFDPKNNPLLSSFGSMPNLLGGNLFANLGLGLPGFSGLDMNSLGAGASTDKNKSRKSDGGSSSSKAPNSQFPFGFTNPNMLYPQLGLGGLNPFGLHSGMASAYDALGLLGTSLGGSTAPTMHSTSYSTARGTKHTTTSPKHSTVVTNTTPSRQQKPSSSHSSQMPQIVLPPDTYLLESLSKQTLNYENMLKAEKKFREMDTHEATDLSRMDKRQKAQYDAMRSHIPPEFAAVQEKLLKGDKKDIDISKMLLEQMASGALSASLVSAAEGKKTKESDLKDLAEKCFKGPTDYLARHLASEASTSGTLNLKRTHDDLGEPENLSLAVSTEVPPYSKKHKNEIAQSAQTGEMDLEDLIAPSTVIKTGMNSKQSDVNKYSMIEADKGEKILKDETTMKLVKHDSLEVDAPKPDNEHPVNKTIDDENNETNNEHKRGRKSSEDGSNACQKRELRSNYTKHGSDP